MARRNKQRKQKPKSADAVPLPASRNDEETSTSQSLRETVESIVIAFVLAFLFRTFEAEAFVIPTGSMAPTLMGRHKDVYCTECNERFQITASDEQREDVLAMQRSLADDYDCVAGVCPNCRYTMPVGGDLPLDIPEFRTGGPMKEGRSYAGDRILVNKYIYSFQDPERWDVVVFKFPGRAEQNYIKRLVGLPGETLRIFQGDLFVGPQDATPDSDFAIERKPASKVLALRQLVHDTDHDPLTLYEAGWPLRWNPSPDNATGWEATRTPDGKLVRQHFASDPSAEGTAWIRYEHFLPDYQTWLIAEGVDDVRFRDPPALDNPRPQLVTDFSAYNTQITRRELEVRRDLQHRPTLQGVRANQGLHWVGDLTVEADVQVASGEGELLLDLVEGGQHFTCTFDLATGQAQLAIEGLSGFAPTATTSLKGAGSHRVALANVDDQLLVWVDGKLVEFDAATTYDADQVFGDREHIRPQSSPDEPGDLAPAGVGSRGAEVTVDRLRVYRDIYYIATDWKVSEPGEPVTDLPGMRFDISDDFYSDPSRWEAFTRRRKVEFSLDADQFFVMGDNCPASLDARLWRGQNSLPHPGRPGGSYLERRLLIGKALCVYWPHSWYHIPGTPIPVFPNFGDMRLVR